MNCVSLSVSFNFAVYFNSSQQGLLPTATALQDHSTWLFKMIPEIILAILVCFPRNKVLSDNRSLWTVLSILGFSRTLLWRGQGFEVPLLISLWCVSSSLTHQSSYTAFKCTHFLCNLPGECSLYRDYTARAYIF